MNGSWFMKVLSAGAKGLLLHMDARSLPGQSGYVPMKQLLKDSDGRQLLLARGCAVDQCVLLVEGEPLILLDDPDCLLPSMMDSIAASIPGCEVVGAHLD